MAYPNQWQVTLGGPDQIKIVQAQTKSQIASLIKMLLSDDEAECWLVHYILTKMLKFCLEYPIDQLSKVSASALLSLSTIKHFEIFQLRN